MFGCSSTSEPRGKTFFSVYTLAILMPFIYNILFSPILGIKVFNFSASARIFAWDAISFLTWPVFWPWHSRINNKYSRNTAIFGVLSNCTTHHFSSLDKQSLAQTITTGNISFFLRNSGVFLPSKYFLHSIVDFIKKKKSLKFRTFFCDNLSALWGFNVMSIQSWQTAPYQTRPWEQDHHELWTWLRAHHITVFTQWFSCAWGEKGRGICGAITLSPSQGAQLCQPGAEQWLSSITATTARLSWEADRDGWPGLPDQ